MRPAMLRLDLGREKNTWMDARWARSGIRLSVSILVAFHPSSSSSREGNVIPLRSSPFLELGLEGGKWRLEGETLAFDLMTQNGLKRMDLTLEPKTKLYFAINAWPRRVEEQLQGKETAAGTEQPWIISKRRGTVCIEQMRWVVRRERRTVGGFTAKVIEEGEGSQLELIDIEPLRVSRGSFDGPMYS
jgi:hypothetical protein